MNEPAYRNSDSVVLLVARICLSVLFLTGGIKKLLTYGAFVGYLTSKGIPFPGVMALPAIATELVGGVLLVLGVRIRILAPYLGLYTLFTAFSGHPFWTFDDPKMRAEMTIQFWKNIAIVGGFLTLYASGGGRLALSKKTPQA